jgi:predicted ester cyclase
MMSFGPASGGPAARADCSLAPSIKYSGVTMNKFLAAAAVISTMAVAGSSASAQMNEEAARASLVPFYKALNAANAQEAPELIKQSTTPGWVTCRGNDLCNTRDEVMAAIGQRLRGIPDLKWEIKEVVVSGNHVIVRGEATGTPAGELMGTPTNGKSFKLMSLDLHTIDGGKIARTYHVEDWQGAFRQVSQK